MATVKSAARTVKSTPVLALKGLKKRYGG